MVQMRILCTGASGFIGTNLVDSLLTDEEIELLNIDIEPPNRDEHRRIWRECDILDLPAVLQAFVEFQPTHVIHLAARTDTDSTRLGDYVVNTEGTANVLEVITSTSSVQHLIVTSTQFVCGQGTLPAHDQDFFPTTAYGESKVIAEKLTREMNPNCCWTIIRPTNIWGPWHPRYPKEFWYVLKRGRYLHPGHEPVIRCYGYVGNVVYQIRRILESPSDKVDKKVYYVGDRPINIYEWVNGFSRTINGTDVRVVPRSVVKSLALFGDLLSHFNIRFPISSSRFRSMTSDYLTPMEPTFEAFGDPPFSLGEGISITTQWLTEQGYL